VTTPTSYYHYDISSDCQPKVDLLIKCLLEEKQQAEELNEPYMGLVFVQRRDCAFALTQVLKHHPRTKDIFRVGCLVGASESTYRRSLDITRGALRKDGNTLDQFRIGELNLIVATAVAEEGIDVQACGSVIRWDAPPTMVSFTQSRGRARRRHSTFTLLVEEDSPNAKDLAMWQELEQQMVKLYRRARDAPQRTIYDDGDDPDLNSPNRVELRSSVTG
jgi:ERCC4-related helicase